MTTASTKGAPNDCSQAVRINEVVSSGGEPGDWVELANPSPADADVSGWQLKDDNDSRDFAIADGTVVPAGGYLVLEEADFGFGLGSADSARLYDATGELVDSFSWTGHGSPSWGRCPDGTGDFAQTESATKGSENHCEGQVLTQPWPGPDAVEVLDPADQFDGDLSGLDITADGSVLYGVHNGDGILYALDPATGAHLEGWEGGKVLRYADGAGVPDAEGVTVTDSGDVFVGTERNNDASGTSRMSVLRYDASAASPLPAITEWNLNASLPAMGANSGIEAVEWVADEALEMIGYGATRSAAPHFGGVFFVALEGNGLVYAFELFEDGTHHLLGEIDPGMGGTMALDYGVDEQVLRAFCDEVCQGQWVELRIVDGEFAVDARYAAPGDMDVTFANEGVAISPLCVDSTRDVWFADDSDNDGSSLRRAGLDCVEAPVQPVTDFGAAASALTGVGANVWGTTGAGATVSTQVQLPGGEWSTSQTRTAAANGWFVVPLTYGSNVPGTYQWRLVIDHGEAGIEVTGAFAQRRVSSVAHAAAPAAPSHREANVWGHAVGGGRVSTQVRLSDGSWSTSQVRTADANGWFVVPLTYGFGTSGEYTWRLVVELGDGTLEVTAPFVQQRVGNPSATSAGAARVGTQANVWGTVDTDAPTRVWTQAYVPGRGWSTSQVATTNAQGGYVLPLTYGHDVAGAHQFRVVTEHPVLGILASEPFTFVRTN